MAATPLRRPGAAAPAAWGALGPAASRCSAAAALVLAWAVVPGCTALPARDPDRILADARTSARVRAALLADPLVGGSALAVDVHEGVATLTGVVPDEATAARASSIVREAPGVRAVTSRVSVEAPSASGTAR